MKTSKAISTIIAASLAIPALMSQTAVKKVSDMATFNSGTREDIRPVRYYPEDDAFVCINGSNRFTRALYGGPSDYRLETSDMPVFGLYKNGSNTRNVRFNLRHGGKTYALDSISHCKAYYKGGSRKYVLNDPDWGEASVIINAYCLADTDGAIWEFETEGFDSPVIFTALTSDTKLKKMQRSGDIGVEKPGRFEPDNLLATQSWQSSGNDTSYVMAEALDIKTGGDITAKLLPTLAYNESLSGMIRFETPEPWLNTLDQAMVFAADGAYDGETWLHGAVGWHTPLTGWRAAYLGDVLGWHDRARAHFSAYADSQVTDVPPTIPHPAQDAKNNMARADKRWGTQMYSNGYICRRPHVRDVMHHYDMNLNYIDELLWHFEYDADTAYMKRMWPVLTSHLEWEKRNFDPDGDSLYDAYCCIWASDALYYNGGAVTHSSAYNYRANRMAAKIAKLIGEDGSKYEQEADNILRAMNSQLWTTRNSWAEYKDKMGHGRVHDDAAIWSVYTPVDCNVGTPGQMWQATDYATRNLPHIPVLSTDDLSFIDPDTLYTVASTNWLPYSWSINNVAPAEIMNLAGAYFESGRPEEGYRLLKANVADQMYLGQSPGNFGQISALDAARGESYRDFPDCTATSARAIIQGLFGIIPNALDGVCVIRPSFPSDWDSCRVSTPYLSYSFKRKDGRDVFEIEQNFSKPLKIVLRENLDRGEYSDITGTDAKSQTLSFPTKYRDSRSKADYTVADPTPSPDGLGLDYPSKTYAKRVTVPMSAKFNANVADIFKQEYLSPRPDVTTLRIPIQGIGEWCHPLYTPEINDSVFRTKVKNGIFNVAGVDFSTPDKGLNIAYTSLWDNYPESINIDVKPDNFGAAYLMLAGSTNHMQTRMENARVTATYTDGTTDVLQLIPPFNWCPIEQDYYVDGMAFSTVEPRPYRIALGTGDVSRNLGETLKIEGIYGREIPGGGAQMLKMHLNHDKKLRQLTLTTVSNDVVIGLMAVTLEK